jgi:D-amino-acid dehydrogenase
MICIIGAGIIGCASAYQLARSGHQVILLDAASGPGQGCSFANGAQLSYSYVEPLATPATLRALPRLLLQTDSPVRFCPTLDWRQYAWGLQFLASCRGSQVRLATRELLELSALSKDTLEVWIKDGVIPSSFWRNGKLVLCPDESTWRRQRRQMEFQAELGCEQQALSLSECIEKEPALLQALSRTAGAWAGGIWTPGECVVDAHALCCALVDRLPAFGCQTIFGKRALGFVQDRGGVQAVVTADGEIPCRVLVLAAGAGSVHLSKLLGEYLPVYPIRGYSLTLPMADTARAPRVSVTDLGRKMVFAPLGSELRVAAGAEIGGYQLRSASDRIKQMRSAIEVLYPHCVEPHARGRAWAGLRPATPTSIPIIRRMRRRSNVYLNVGHGALGLTLAAGSAAVLARTLNGL